MELKDKLKGKLKEFEALVEEINKLLEEAIDEPEEEEKDKIELLDEYMKTLDDRLFVKESFGFISLKFTHDDYDYTICRFESFTNEFEEFNHGSSPEDLFNELLKYKYAFKGKYDELFKEDNND